MTIPDIDYALGLQLGQFEYSVPMAVAKPDDIAAVSLAFKAGEQKVLDLLRSMANRDGRIYTSVSQIEELLKIKKDEQ